MARMPLSALALHCFESSSFFAQDLIFSRDCDIILGKDRKLYKIYEEYRKNHDNFYDYTRVRIGTFDYILENIQFELEKKRNSQRDLSAGEKLFLTLRLLSSEISFISMAKNFCVGRSTVSKTLYQTLKAIWLQFAHKYLPPKLTTERLRRITNDFFSKRQFPNCIGAIDNRHFKIQRAPRKNPGYRYKKKYFTLALQAVSDADYKFTLVEFNDKEKQKEGDTFHCSELNELLSKNRFNLPPVPAVPDSDITLPYVLVGDESYPLKTFLMRPYPTSILDDQKTIFNERLSRAKATIDGAFAVMINKWRFLQKTIETNVKHAKLIIKVACLLHNIIRERDGNKDPDFQQYFQRYESKKKSCEM